MSENVLVLDTSYQPIGTMRWEKAFCLWFKNKVEILETYDKWVHSVSQAFKMPSVIRFLKNVIRKTKKIRFSRDNIYNRDKGKCQYCGDKVSREDFTLDHCKPKSRGGITTFENVVVACFKCNTHKGCKMPEEAGMKLLNVPVRPKNLFQQFSWMPHFPLEWQSFLYWHQELENDEKK